MTQIKQIYADFILKNQLRFLETKGVARTLRLTKDFIFKL